ncbi:hypothetical protein ABFX02_06G094300 [Erythranthe guttata]
MKNISPQIAFIAIFILQILTLSEASRVTVINDITIHCYSSEDDLGVHALSYGAKYSWHFHVNFWGTTIFNCDFTTKIWFRELRGSRTEFEAAQVHSTMCVVGKGKRPVRETEPVF